MPQVKRFQVVFAKTESVEGTDPVPTGPDALQLVQPAAITWGAYQNNEQDDKDNEKLEPDAPLAPSYPWAEIACRLYIRGKGAAYSTTAGPEPHAVIPAAGFSSTLTASEWIYDTLSAVAGGLKTLTFYAFKGLDTNVYVLHKILAARVKSLRFSGEAGRPGFLDVVARGEYVEPTDTAIIAPTYFTSIAPRFAAAGSWALGAFSTGFVKRASVTIENTVAFRENANAATVRHLITGRRLLWDVGVEAARVADYNPWLKWTTRAQEALTMVFGTGGGNNKLTIAADRAQITEEPASYEEENGLIRFAAKGVLDPGGTNRIKLTYNT